MIEPDKIIYLDNNATTQLDPAVIEEMLPCLMRYYGNPSSGYQFAAQVRRAIDLARERVASLLGCEPPEIVFTSGGTEANNTAINSALQLDPQRRHIVTSAVEHSATWKHCAHLEKQGVEVTSLGVDREGNLNLDALDASIRADTAVISIMWANNETGVIFPVEAIAEIARRKRVLFHTDAVQLVGKLPIDLAQCPVNSLALSAHKLHGPKGVGALYLSRRSAFRPSLFGGSHENDRRAGTENVAGIVGFGKAAELAAAALKEEKIRVGAMRDRFEATILERVPGTSVNGAHASRLPNTTSLAFAGIESGAVLMMLDRQGVCCSAGSACRTGSLQSSHVLRAMGRSDAEAGSSLRFSFGRFNSEADVERGAGAIESVIAKLRRLSQPTAAHPSPSLA